MLALKKEEGPTNQGASTLTISLYKVEDKRRSPPIASRKESSPAVTLIFFDLLNF